MIISMCGTVAHIFFLGLQKIDSSGGSYSGLPATLESIQELDETNHASSGGFYAADEGPGRDESLQPNRVVSALDFERASHFFLHHGKGIPKAIYWLDVISHADVECFDCSRSIASDWRGARAVLPPPPLSAPSDSFRAHLSAGVLEYPAVVSTSSLPPTDPLSLFTLHPRSIYICTRHVFIFPPPA